MYASDNEFQSMVDKYEGTSAFSEGGLTAARIASEVLHKASTAPSNDADDVVLSVEKQQAVLRRCSSLLMTKDAAWAAAERIGFAVDPTAFGVGVAFELALTAETLRQLPGVPGTTQRELRESLCNIAHTNMEEADNRYGPHITVGVPDELEDDA